MPMFQLPPNTDRARILHGVLHRRLVSFVEKYSPDLAQLGEDVVTNWLNRFYCGDPSIIIMLYMDEVSYTITAHAVIEVQRLGSKCVVCVHQLEYDTKGVDKVEECIKFVDDLVVQVGAELSSLEVPKNVKVYQRYGYKVHRTLLIKPNITYAQDVQDDA